MESWRHLSVRPVMRLPPALSPGRSGGREGGREGGRGARGREKACGREGGKWGVMLVT